MLISNFQLDQTAKRFAERRPQRERNERLIKEKRYLDIDSPDRVQKFLARRGFYFALRRRPTRSRNCHSGLIYRSGFGIRRAASPARRKRLPG